MANIPQAPKEGTSSTSSDEKAILFMTEDDGASGLQASLFWSTYSETINGQRVGGLGVNGLTADDAAMKGNCIPGGGLYEATPTAVDDGDVKTFLIDPNGRLEVVIDESYPITAEIYNVTLTSSDTEYYQSLPDDTMALRFQCRTAYAIRYALVTGKVAGPVTPYMTLKSGDVYEKDNISLTGHTLYLASSQAAVQVEIEVWHK